MYRSNVNRYQENKVMLSSPGEVLLALYDGAIRFARQARIAIEINDPAVKGQKIGSVMAILAELTATLDHDRAPELCTNLEALYSYMVDRLQQAGVDMDVEPLDEVIRHLQRLRETWAEAVKIASEDEPEESQAATGA